MEFNFPTTETIVTAAIAYFYPYIAQTLKGTFLGGHRTLMFLGGLFGTGVAILSNIVLTQFGLSQPETINNLVILGFGVTVPISEAVYRTLIKK